MPLFGFQSYTQEARQGVRESVVEILKKDETALRALNIAELSTAGPEQIFNAFLKATDPSYRKDGQGCYYASWICKNFLKDARKGEDLYRIREDLQNFKAFSKQLSQDGQPNQIDKVPGFDALMKMVLPYQKKRDEKKQKLSLYFKDAAEQKEILAQTTVFYDGPEGCIVMPHSQKAAQHWGNNTRWCIAAKDMEQNYFDGYNKQHPVIIYSPRQPTADDKKNFPDYTSFKIAAVGSLYDELDYTAFSRTPDCIKKLIAAAKDQLPLHIAAYLEEYGKTEGLLSRQDENIPEKSQPPQPVAEKKDDPPPSCPAAWLPWLELLSKTYNWDEETDYFHRVMQNLPHELAKDKNFALAALQKNQNNILRYLAPELRDDKEVVLASIKNNGSSIEHASERLRNDRDVALAAVTRSGYTLKYLSSEVQNDRDIVLTAVQESGSALQYASKEVVRIKEVVLAAVRRSGLALEDAPKKMRADKEVVLAAVQQYGRALHYASWRLRNNKEIVSTAVRTTGGALQDASRWLRNNKEIVSIAVQQDGMALRYASHTVQNDENIVLSAALNTPATLFYSPKLQKDKNFLSKIVMNNFGNIMHLSESTLQDTGLVARFLQTAIESDQDRYNIVKTLRHIPSLQGDAEAIASPDHALKKLKSSETDVRIRQTFQHSTP